MDLIEIDGRITALRQLLHTALDQVVVLSGQLVLLQKQLADQKASQKEPKNDSTS